MPIALLALAVGAFGIGMTEFVIAGILPQIATSFGVDIPQAGLMATVYALGVFVGAPLLTILGANIPRKKMLVGLAVIFTIGNIITALAPTLPIALAGRIVTSFNHGAFWHWFDHCRIPCCTKSPSQCHRVYVYRTDHG